MKHSTAHFYGALSLITIIVIFAAVVAIIAINERFKDYRELSQSAYQCELTVDYFEAHYVRRIGHGEHEHFNILSIDNRQSWLVVERKTRKVLGYLHELYPEADPAHFKPEYTFEDLHE